MSDKWIGRIVTLLFFGVPAFLFSLVAIYGSVDGAFISWFTAKERAEQRELYSIIGDQEVDKVATKYISGNIVCFDSFNETELPMEFERAFVRTRNDEDDVPLRGAIFLFTGADPMDRNGFSRNVPPKNCKLQNEELNGPIEIDKERMVNGICERSALISEILRTTLDGSFWIRSEDGQYLDGAYAETQYDVKCKLEINELRDCLPRNYGSKLSWSRTHESDFGLFTEYNYCDNSENAEFKRQVLDKWARARGN